MKSSAPPPLLLARKGRCGSAAVVAGLLACLCSSPSRAGLPDLNLDKLKKATEQGKKEVDAMRPMTLREELALGETVGRRLKSNYGVLGENAIQRYVTLVGMTVARHVPSREGVTYRFIVLDTDLVNAFSVPGGDIYVTKGLLRAASSEAQLAGVLGHELHHCAARHAAKAIEKTQRWGAIGEASLDSQPALLQAATKAATEVVLTGYGRTEESESDVEGLGTAVASGYEPQGLSEFLAILRAEKKKEGSDKKKNNGLLGSHPEVSARIERLEKKIQANKLQGGARLADRYGAAIPFASPDATLAGLKGSDGASPSGSPDEAAQVEGSKKGGNSDTGTVNVDTGGEKPKKKKKGFSLSGLLNMASDPSGKAGGAVAASDDRSATGGVRGVDQEVVESDGRVPFKDPDIKVTKEQLAAFIEEGRLVR